MTEQHDLFMRDLSTTMDEAMLQIPGRMRLRALIGKPLQVASATYRIPHQPNGIGTVSYVFRFRISLFFFFFVTP